MEERDHSLSLGDLGLARLRSFGFFYLYFSIDLAAIFGSTGLNRKNPWPNQ
jgi:hypothetical protein